MYDNTLKALDITGPATFACKDHAWVTQDLQNGTGKKVEWAELLEADGIGFRKKKRTGYSEDYVFLTYYKLNWFGKPVITEAYVYSSLSEIIEILNHHKKAMMKIKAIPISQQEREASLRELGVGT